MSEVLVRVWLCEVVSLCDYNCSSVAMRDMISESNTGSNPSPRSTAHHMAWGTIGTCSPDQWGAPTNAAVECEGDDPILRRARCDSCDEQSLARARTFGANQ
eukprot:3175726-Rhodomonas_salina.1